MMNVLIFSKDRAAQLDLLLRSIYRHFINWESFSPKILYTFSNEFFHEGYKKLIKEHDNFEFILESNFKADLIRILNKDFPYTMFGVDDDVFLNSFSFYDAYMSYFMSHKDIFCLSLRMHPDISYCYTQRAPSPGPKLSEWLTWEWRDLPGDWGYPLSVDFTIFRTNRIYQKILDFSYQNPNTFEGIFAAKFEVLESKMICYPKPRMVNIPVNKVQTANGNHCGNISAESLNEKYLEGKRIDMDKIEFNEMNAPHVEAKFHFK